MDTCLECAVAMDVQRGRRESPHYKTNRITVFVTTMYCKVLQGKVGQESDWSVGGSLNISLHLSQFWPLSDQSDHSICYNYTVM